MRTSQPIFAAAQAKFAIDKLGAKKIALSYLSTDFGNGGANAQKPVIESSGATLAADLPHAQDVTDLTADILAAKDADVVLASDFPNDLALWLKQSADNGLNIPVIGGGSTQVMVSNKLAEGDLLANLYGVDDCNVGGDPQTLDFAAAWSTEYGYPASGTAALFYDSLFVAKQAIEDAQSTDPGAIRDALEKVQFSGVCHNYKGDAKTHDLAKSVSVAKFNTDGTTTPIAVIDG
jgi:branched-chain amino acid transport system substrate-binding protein